jgi:hypothetical protein
MPVCFLGIVLWLIFARFTFALEIKILTTGCAIIEDAVGDIAVFYDLKFVPLVYAVAVFLTAATCQEIPAIALGTIRETADSILTEFILAGLFLET